MRWDDVRYFLEVARSGTLTGAADVLGVNHSTVFRRLNALEDQLRVKLFDREGGRYALTEAGRAALGDAERAADALSSLQRTVTGHDDALAGPVRLTAPEALLPLLAPHLGPFRKRFPGIDLQVRFADRFFDLARHEADVALRPIPRPQQDDLVARRICGIAWAPYRPRGASGQVPWAAYADDLETLAAARWRRANHGDQPVALSVNSVPAMLGVICAAGCQGMLPCFVGDADPNVERCGAPIPEAASALWLMVHPDLRSAARVRALLDHLWDAMRGHASLFEGEP